jgi:hypothetical protein
LHHFSFELQPIDDPLTQYLVAVTFLAAKIIFHENQNLSGLNFTFEKFLKAGQFSWRFER